MGNKIGGSYPGIGQDPNNHLNSLDIDEVWSSRIDQFLSFVWCDASIGSSEHANDIQNTIMNIAHTVNQTRQIIHTFNELNVCREFLTNLDNVCLITSGSMGEILVPLIHNLEQIHSIYVFCFDTGKHEQWAKHYSKIRRVHNDITLICQLLQPYIISQSLIDFDRIEFDLISHDINSPTVDKKELCLIYSKLIQIILFNMNTIDDGKQDMIDYCRNEYHSDYKNYLIKTFETNYTQFNPIWWYTKNWFFQGVINRALAKQNLYVLCSMYRFIKDIHLNLKQLYEIQRTSSATLELYFGQFLSKYDLDKIKDNRGGLILINQFLTAYPEQGIPMMFLKQQNLSTLEENKIRVLFKIHIDQTIESIVPYANIGSISQFVHEKEHLISMSSIYRIDKIEKLSDIQAGYYVHLTLISRTDRQYNNLTQYIQEDQLDDDIHLSDLGDTIKKRLHPFKSANKLFQQALIKKNERLRAITLHYNMAIIYDSLFDYEQSLEQYQCVLKIAGDEIATDHGKDDLCLVPVYSNMGLTYQHDNKFSYAFPRAFRALGTVSALNQESLLKKELEAACCYNLGLIHDLDRKIDSARNFYEQALRIRQEYLPIGHPDILLLQEVITLLSTGQENSNYKF